MYKIFTVFWLTLCVGLSAFAENIQVETCQEVVAIKHSPKPIAAFDMSALNTLDALNIEGLVSVGNTYLDHLSQYAGNIRALFEPNIEQLVRNERDLIIVGERSSSQLENIRHISPSIDMTVWGKNWIEQTHTGIEAYGRIFGQDAEAQSLISTLDKKLPETHETFKRKGGTLIIMTNEGKVSAYVVGRRFGWIHDALEIKEVVENVEDTKAHPEWLLVIDYAQAIREEVQNAQSTLNNTIVDTTNAARNNQIVYLNSAQLYVASAGT